jgi:cell division initiation protein
LLQAQEATGRTYESARKEAELIVKEAEQKAAKIVEQANSDLARSNSELVGLRSRKESLIGRLRVLLSAELDLIRTLELGGDERFSGDASLGSGKEKVEIDQVVKSIDNERATKTH